MKIVVRADASLQIGTGHIMRCLTLAHALKSNGAEISFICRAYKGNLINRIREDGFETFELPLDNKADDLDDSYLLHSAWLGVTQEEDMKVCLPILQSVNPDWLIVDHYALDLSWEKALEQSYEKLMVIDDLADRVHLCDMLLDQTFGRNKDDYNDLVPADCTKLIGSDYVLLKPDFLKLRSKSLARRSNPSINSILVSMGGVDSTNVTSEVLKGLNQNVLPNDVTITVIMGPSAPFIEEVKKQAKDMKYQVHVLTNVDNVAEIMTGSDLAIGAAGTTTWERCCLGLPTIMVVLADNQKYAASVLNENKIVLLLDNNVDIASQLVTKINFLKDNNSELRHLSENSMKIVDGKGVERVIDCLFEHTVR